MFKLDTGRKVFSFVIVIICLVKLIVLWVTYVQWQYNLNNPLIPRQLIEWKLNYSLALTTVYVAVIGLNLFYLLKLKGFWLIAVISIVIIVTTQLFSLRIEQYFLSQ